MSQRERVCVYRMHMQWHLCGGQDSLQELLLSFYLWSLGIELKCSVLELTSFTHGAISST